MNEFQFEFQQFARGVASTITDTTQVSSGWSRIKRITVLSFE
jgi:hypothetical protein